MHHKHDDIEEELEHRKDELPISLKVKISKTIKEIRQKIPYKKVAELNLIKIQKLQKHQ